MQAKLVLEPPDRDSVGAAVGQAGGDEEQARALAALGIHGLCQYGVADLVGQIVISVGNPAFLSGHRPGAVRV